MTSSGAGDAAGVPGKGDPTESGRARILVVDDTPESVRLLAGLLEVHGFEPVVAQSGEQALSAIAADPPDLVLLDLIMPGIDGHQVCQRLRGDPRLEFLPVIMLTSAGNDERIRALEAGADDFLVKPIDQPELLARVRSLVRIKRYHDRIEEQAGQLATLNRDLEARVEAQVEQMSRLSRLRRFFPPTVADLVTSADEKWLLDTHRREVAVLFADLRGFTAFAHSAEPEEVVLVLREFHRAAGEVVRRHGATVGWLSGDGLMVFVNDPLPCDDPAGTAVSLASELRQTMRVLLGQWREDGRELGMGVGIAMGYATLGILGVDERIEYGPVGSVVNLASRLCDSASDGEILVSQSMRAALGDAVSAERVGPLELRGFPAPVSAWRLAHEPTERTGSAGKVAHSAGAESASSWRSPGSVGPDPAEENVFRLDGDDWTLAFNGMAVHARDSKGLAYLGRLLSMPGREIHVADLIGLTVSEAPTLRSRGGPVIDDRARQAYQRRIAELEAERDEAREWGDLERAARADEEIGFLVQELSSAYGLGGRPRRIDDPSERVRKAVTNRIRQSMARIDGLHPSLGRHLLNSVRTGTFCSYQPEGPVEWKL